MLIRHSAIYIVAKIVPGLLGMATTAILTRLLAPAEYGLYSLALLVMTFGAGLAFDWLGLAYLRVAQLSPDRPRATSTFVQLFAALAAGTALLAAGWFALQPAHAGILAAGLLMAWAYGWFELVARFHVADLEPGAYLRMNLGRAVLNVLAAGSVAALTRDAVCTAYAAAAAMLLSACIGGGGRLGGARIGRAGFDRALARSALRFGLPLAASLLLTSLIGSGTRAMVDWLGSLEALGRYTAALMLVQNTLAVAAAGVAAAGFSLAVRAVDTGDPAIARRQLEANATLLLSVLAPAALGMALTAPSIAAVLVGAHYAETVATLTPWMAIGALFAGFRAHYLDHAFQLGRHPRGQVWVSAGAALVTIPLNLWLIPRFGPLGAAIAVAAGAASSTLHALVAGRVAFPLPLPGRAAGRIALACAIMALAVRLVPGVGPIPLLLQVGIGGVAYAGAAFALDILGLRSRAAARFAPAA